MQATLAPNPNNILDTASDRVTSNTQAATTPPLSLHISSRFCVRRRHRRLPRVLHLTLGTLQGHQMAGINNPMSSVGVISVCSQA